jgi:preflagellin peptidase FlaK
VPNVQTIPGMLAATRTSLALIFLLYSSLSDYKTREVSNIVWTVFAPSAFALTFVELFLYPYKTSDMLLYGLSFGLTAAFAVILFYSGGFGGADAKALMCLALALPFYPENLFTPISGTISPISRVFFPITVFSNSVLLAAATAVYMFLRNIFGRKRTGKELFEGHENESFGRKVLVLITSYKVSVDKLKEKWHLYPMEDIEQNGENTSKRKLVVIPKDEDRNAMVNRLTKAVDAGKIQNSVWATPGLPMLIFITAGLIIALFFGDIVWICIKFLLG